MWITHYCRLGTGAGTSAPGWSVSVSKSLPKCTAAALGGNKSNFAMFLTEHQVGITFFNALVTALEDQVIEFL